MGKRIEITGQKFNSLTVIEFAHSKTDNHGNTRTYWKCRCDCGNEKTLQGHKIKSGLTKSCGCHRRKDLTGQRFGKLTVIKYVRKKNKNGDACWLCKCDCGNEKVILSRNLTSGATKGCGCSNRIDMTGQKFNMLTAIKFSHMKDRVSYWEFKCDCGNVKVMNGPSVRRSKRTGGTQSCGCLRQWPPGHSARNRALTQQRSNAKRTKLKSTLTDEQVLAIHKMNCHYCNCPPSQVSWQPGQNGEYIYTGIDRVDNDVGYTPENSVPCCWPCNEAKGKIPIDVFLDTVKRIYEHLNLEGRP